MQKNITRIEHPRQSHMVGDGFRVSQYIPGYGREMSGETSPFLMLDYNHPWSMPPRNDGHRQGVGYHPHRGFETVTIAYSGEIEHRDTAGGGGVIGPDEVQWMTAGSGLLHNEFFTDEFSRSGGIVHFIQLWVDLPKEMKMAQSRYQALTKQNIPEVVYAGGKIRVIAGELVLTDSSGMSIEQKGAAETFSPVELYDVRFSEGATIDLAFPDGYIAFVLVVDGSGSISDNQIKTGDMVTFSLAGNQISLSGDAHAKFLIMAGKPLEQEVAAYGPFVMTSEEEIRQAFADFRAGKMGVSLS